MKNERNERAMRENVRRITWKTKGRSIKGRGRKEEAKIRIFQKTKR